MAQATVWICPFTNMILRKGLDMSRETSEGTADEFYN